ncbi:TetR/AcrR family transcriptional regulator [Nannocystis pusilla]|uniref:TetR/AcrR family transcriptional regulator n=1 Tax=Nannocystis pusilla TaxID=889268 RepID=A0ABS7TY32_9BACT|nr:TetR/AcrR family transcriptional regulator [Nannocystis pusilla]MBZ5713042.1 TetR/AcrR family transcriptional regulator [Nannocystis pusilla]
MAVNREHDADHGAPGTNEGTGPEVQGALAARDLRGFGQLLAGPGQGSGRPDSTVDDAATGEAETGTDGRSARAQARREQRRGLILAAATQVFKEKGYHATSVGDIIDAARIARGTFYLYFTSKREIFAALSAGFLAVIRGSVRKISLDPAEGEPLSQMRANFRRVIHTVLEHEDLATIVLRDDALDAEARAQLDLFYEQVIGLIGQAVRVGHRLGIARECDETIIAVSALGALKEILTRMLAASRRASSNAPSALKAVGDQPGEPGAAVVKGGAGDVATGDAAPATPFADPDRLADELLSFFVRGVFTQDTR